MAVRMVRNVITCILVAFISCCGSGDGCLAWTVATVTITGPSLVHTKARKGRSTTFLTKTRIQPCYYSYSYHCNKQFPTLYALKESQDDSPTSNNTSEDWRQFRAKLVLQDQTNTKKINTGDRKNNENGWAYEAGTLVETGSIILSRVESSLGCHDLRQPYFHKCAVLVLEHSATIGTRGIILNRPSNLVCSDDDILLLEDDDDKMIPPNTTNVWPMSFGGDIAGLFSNEPMIVALHSLAGNQKAKQCSQEVLPNLFVTSHAGARSLVAAGEATCEDFYCFYGLAMWEPGMLRREVERGSWYMVSMDAGTVLRSLHQLRHDNKNNPQAAGIACWEDWTRRIGKAKEERVIGSRNAFTDLMLKEWCQEMLCVDHESGIENDNDEYTIDNFDLRDAMDTMTPMGPGSLVRASRSDDPSAFLLYDQLFHKSTILWLKEQDELSLGIILNLPTIDAYIHTLPNGTTVTIPIRYGGPSGQNNNNDDDQKQTTNTNTAEQTEEEGSRTIWLHCNSQLRGMKVGKSISMADSTATPSLIWTCSQIQALHAMDMGLAQPADFLAVQGYVLWEKEMKVGGMAAELVTGKFQPVPMERIADIWSILGSQSPLETIDDVEDTFRKTKKAWNIARTMTSYHEGIETASDGIAAIRQPSNNNDDNASRLVYGTNVAVEELADEALRNWIQIFLLDNVEYIPF